tara:strand:- start:608 stop:1231 length:624 start_codon:yes stop_codon:yes gene_type:complete
MSNSFNEKPHPLLLNNFGFLRRKLPSQLYQSLLKECQKAKKKNPRMTSGLIGPGVTPHYYLSNPENRKNLNKFVFETKDYYDECFPELGNTRTLSKDASYVLEKPWVNVQHQGEFIPSHTHDGIYSYSIWMKIPYDSRKIKGQCAGTFEFTYMNVFGAPMFHRISLSQEDEGSIIMFPSKLRHSAYPFYGTSRTRLCISGNILYNVS